MCFLLKKQAFAAARSADAILIHLQQSQHQIFCFVAPTPEDNSMHVTQTSCIKLNPHSLGAMNCCRATNSSAKLPGRTAKAQRQGLSG